VYKLEAFGDPAHYRQELDNDKGDLSAKAKSMEYVADNGKLVLRENVRIVKGEDVFTGNIIEYSTRDEIVSARKAESGEERVQVIIQPRQQTPQPNAQ
jgi:lipopolysaccharide export system protein LptA